MSIVSQHLAGQICLRQLLMQKNKVFKTHSYILLNPIHRNVLKKLTIVVQVNIVMADWSRPDLDPSPANLARTVPQDTLSVLLYCKTI